MSEKSTSDTGAESNEAGHQILTPLITEDRWDEILQRLFADCPQAAEGLANWLLELKDELESGPKGAARTVKSLRSAIQRVEGLSSKYDC